MSDVETHQHGTELRVLIVKASDDRHQQDPGTSSGETDQGHAPTTDLFDQESVDDDGEHSATTQNDGNCSRDDDVSIENRLTENRLDSMRRTEEGVLVSGKRKDVGTVQGKRKVKPRA